MRPLDLLFRVHLVFDPPSDVAAWSVLSGTAMGALGWFGPVCPGFITLERSGGAASGGGLLTAAVWGGMLWIAAGFAGFVLRRRLGRLALGFVAAYLIGGVLLWNVAELIWGTRHCKRVCSGAVDSERQACEGCRSSG